MAKTEYHVFGKTANGCVLVILLLYCIQAFAVSQNALLATFQIHMAFATKIKPWNHPKVPVNFQTSALPDDPYVQAIKTRLSGVRSAVRVL